MSIAGAHRMNPRYIIDNDLNSMYPTLTIPMVRRTMPNLIAEQIVGVQPMASDLLDGFCASGIEPVFKFDYEPRKLKIDLPVDHFEHEEELFEI